MKECLLLLILCFTGCHGDRKAETTLFSGTAMTIDYHITIGKGLTIAQQQQIEGLIRSTFEEIHTLYNKWNPTSELSRLNKLPANTPVEVSSSLLRLLHITDLMVQVSKGAFDPTIEPLQQVWKKSFSQNTLPQEESLRAVAPAVGWHNIHFEGVYFSKDHDATAMDLGGIAKGYGVDLLTERIVAAGYRDVFVEWGGEIRAAGAHPEGRPWRVYISRLDDNTIENALAVVELNDCAIATSGDYLQYWDVGGERYHHIIDPKTQRPLKVTDTSIASVSVKAPTCVLADGLATPAMMFETLDDAALWAEEVQKDYPRTEFWMLTHDNREVHLPSLF